MHATTDATSPHPQPRRAVLATMHSSARGHCCWESSIPRGESLVLLGGHSMCDAVVDVGWGCVGGRVVSLSLNRHLCRVHIIPHGSPW